MTEAFVDSSTTRVLPPEFDRRYPVIVRGEGAWLEDSAGRRYLDAMSGGSMAATLGHGRQDLVDAARRQAERLSFVHNERLTNPLQEELARELVAIAPDGLGRAKFVTGGAEANETAIKLARAYHVARGEPERWQVISIAQAYHGPTMETLALTGRPGLQGPLGPYLPRHLHVPPPTKRLDPTGEATLEALDRALDQAGPETISIFFLEAISAAALPAFTPPESFWRGLDERRRAHGFLIGFDEVVTGMGRTGTWFAANATPVVPDLVATAKGLGAGYAAIGAVLVADHVYDAFARGPRKFTLGHTWDGAPLSCAVGLKVVDVLRSEGLVDHVRERGARLRDELEEALGDIDLVGEVRGHGYLLGVEYVDPRDGSSFLPPELRAAGRIDDVALENALVILSTQPTRDGMAGDQSLFAPPFTTPDDELAEMVARFAASVRQVADEVEEKLARAPEPLSVSSGDAQ
jgi:adenosylmethionine-8-amino-7-oxononanoate aminotransferase